MSFMQPQIVEGDWYEVDTSHGTEWVEADLVGENPSLEDFWQYTEGEVKEFTLRKGWFGARLSAPGFMDRTDWSCFEKREEAAAHLREEFPEECGEP